MTYLPHTALMVVEPGRVCAWPTGERSAGSQVCLPPSVALEAEHYLWKSDAKRRERVVSYNGSSSPLPLEEQLFPVSEQED